MAASSQRRSRCRILSLLTELAQSQALLIREPGAPPLAKGDPCRILRLP